ncbi:MAG: histidine kinase, partial [Firmicutes bacterium]|nr:histidine kinase [Bacillota bacterium]
GLSPRLVVVSMANLSLALLLGWILADKERAERQSSDAVKAAAQAQAQALQAQMNPHVLFNAISGLTELVHEDPQAAEEALVNLASLLRGLLENGARAKLPLASERALVQRYLALESIRLGNRLRVTWEWDEALESRELPPLLLQPLVENAIKHGIAPHRGGAELTIFLRQSEGRLCMGVINGGEPLQEDLQEGVGLRNLRERLALLGEGREAVKLYPHEGRTVAELCLKGGLA